jgi:hypothetical protein
MYQEDAPRPLVPSANGGQRALRAMHKRPLPKLVVSVDPSTLKYAPIENSIVYKLRHAIPYPPLKPKPYVPIANIESFVGSLRYRGATDEEIEEIRRKNYYVPAEPPPPVPKKKLKKKRATADEDIDKMFSQYTKPVVKKKVLKAVVKKI